MFARIGVKMTKEDMEAFASAEHDKWAHWMNYLFSESEQRDDGAIVIPKEYVDRWQRQANTPYEHLSESERESDRKVVRQFFEPIIKKIVDTPKDHQQCFANRKNCERLPDGYCARCHEQHYPL